MEKLTYRKFFDLGKIPLVNNLNSSFEESINCEKFDLAVGIAQNGLVRLMDIVDSKLLFDKYLYLSGTSKPFIEHCTSMAKYLQTQVNICEGDVIIDIGGNDATLLINFKHQIDKKVRYINIEPSDVVNFITDNEIETINSYFDHHIVDQLETKAKIIVSTNVFQHLFDISSFVSNIHSLLTSDGIWCLEFPYWYESMKTLQFDQIYHEHIYYYNVLPLKDLLEIHKLRVFSIQPQSIHGGSLRLLICKENAKYKTDASISKYVDLEKEIASEFYEEWGKKIITHAELCKSKILEISNEKKIVVFGAAAKGCVFLNYLGFDHKNILYVIDDTRVKQGKYMPGTGLKIYERQKIKEVEPDYILILAHNFKDYIINSLKDFGYKNKFIVCLPNFEIIN